LSVRRQRHAAGSSLAGQEVSAAGRLHLSRGSGLAIPINIDTDIDLGKPTGHSCRSNSRRCDSRYNTPRRPLLLRPLLRRRLLRVPDDIVLDNLLSGDRAGPLSGGSDARFLHDGDCLRHRGAQKRYLERG